MTSIKKLKKLLLNSTWVVPYSTLKGYISGNKNIPVIDQTVWIIDKFDDRYFFGTSYIMVDYVPLSVSTFIGSITTNNDVMITFTTGNSSITSFSKFIHKSKGFYYFEMQMNNTIINNKSINHWSYMISVSPNDKLYKKLPGSNNTNNISVPEFISLFEKNELN